MSIAELARRSYYDDDSSSTNYTTIIVIIVVVLVLKIALISWLCIYRNKKRKERRAKGCNCYSDVDYYCLPWWYWTSDKRCHCGALNNTAFNAPPQQAQQPPSYSYAPTPTYSPTPQYATGPSYPPTNGYNAAPSYPPTQYTSSSHMEAGQWNSQQQAVPMKPPQQVQTSGQYY